MDKAVIFDWDGVVVDSSEAHCLAWERLAGERALPLPEDHMERGFGKKNTTIIPDILNWSHDTAEVKELSDRKEELYRELLAEGKARVLPGARELLEALSAEGIPCVVGSSTDRANIEQALEQFDLQEYFKDFAAAEDCRAGKPAPDVFLIAARKAGVLPGSCLVIEDAPYGIEAAHRAGMQAIGLLTSHPPEVMATAELVIPDLSHLNVETLLGLLSRAEKHRIAP